MKQVKFCPSCGLTVGEQIGGKLALGATGALVGGKVDPLLGLIVGLIGAWLGHVYIDSAITNCPQCGTALMIVQRLL